jgi:hypothetical protein
MSREYSWTSPPSVKESIDRVLTERGFYYLWERDEKTLRFRTSFAPLTNLDSPIHLKGQIALLITLLDYEMGEPKQEIRIRWIVMERRQLTAQYRISQDPSVLSTAARFVDSFVEDMRRVKPLR